MQGAWVPRYPTLAAGHGRVGWNDLILLSGLREIVHCGAGTPLGQTDRIVKTLPSLVLRTWSVISKKQ